MYISNSPGFCSAIYLATKGVAKVALLTSAAGDRAADIAARNLLRDAAKAASDAGAMKCALGGAEHMTKPCLAFARTPRPLVLQDHANYGPGHGAASTAGVPH